MTFKFLPLTFRLWATDDNPETLRKMGLEPVRMLTSEGQMAIMGSDDEDGNRQRVLLVDCHTPFKRGQGYKAECPTRDAFAAFVVEAVNTHQGLLAALSEIKGATSINTARQIANAALAKVQP